WAPSAHNRQPWRFAALMTEKPKTRLAEAMGAEFRQALLAEGLTHVEAEAQVARSGARIQEAPVVIVLCLDTAAMDAYADAQRQEGEYLMGVQSVAMAGSTLLLAAHAQGLGGVWLCAPLFASEAVQAALDLPESWKAQGMALLGYPAQTPQAKPRRPLREVTRFL
ncbi:MAG: nitroreductase family protein, partial [Anaerolineae bacterium]|nr:nitroreductase family protein [Anaerolineae bacterium]